MRARDSDYPNLHYTRSYLVISNHFDWQQIKSIRDLSICSFHFATNIYLCRNTHRLFLKSSFNFGEYESNLLCWNFNYFFYSLNLISFRSRPRQGDFWVIFLFFFSFAKRPKRRLFVEKASRLWDAAESSRRARLHDFCSCQQPSWYAIVELLCFRTHRLVTHRLLCHAYGRSFVLYSPCSTHGIYATHIFRIIRCMKGFFVPFLVIWSEDNSVLMPTHLFKLALWNDSCSMELEFFMHKMPKITRYVDILFESRNLSKSIAFLNVWILSIPSILHVMNLGNANVGHSHSFLNSFHF